MKVIDLLNKIAKGEEVPKKIKYINSIWKYDEEKKDYFHDGLWLIYSMNSIGLTEREVEILEEEKKIPEKLKIGEKSVTIKGTTFFRDKDIEIFQKLSMEINEIIDYLKSKGE